MQRTTKSDLVTIIETRIAPHVDVDGDLMLHVGNGGRGGNTYQLRVRNPENGGQRGIGPHCHAKEMEYFLRGITFGRDLERGRYASDDE